MSNLKFVKTSSLSNLYLAQFYSSHPELVGCSYSKQYAALMSDCFAWADFWKYNLESAGLSDAIEIVANAIPLQNAWWQENVSKTLPDSQWQILEEQLIQANPDVWFCHAPEVSPQFRMNIRKQLPRLKLVIGMDGVAWHNPAHFAGCDLILTCLNKTVDFYKAHGFDSYYMGGGFEPSVYERVGPQKKAIPVSFVGGGWMGKNGHFSRLHFLDQLSSRINIQLHLSGLASTGDMLLQMAHYLKRGDVKSFLKVVGVSGAAHRLFAMSKAPLFGLKMYQCLGQSEITLNYHIDAAGNEAANMRLYEATGMGACLLTDNKPNISRFFKPDEEIVVFDDLDDCLEKIKYLQGNPAVRNRISSAGRVRTERDYSLSSFIKEFWKYLSMKL